MRRRSRSRHEDKRPQLPVPLFSYATFLAYFMARRFQETGISHRIDVNVNVTVE